MPWSEWAWDDPNKQWARYRLVAEGRTENPIIIGERIAHSRQVNMNMDITRPWKV